MDYHGIDFDYLASDEKFSNSLAEADYRAVIISDYPSGNFADGQLQVMAGKVKAGAGMLMFGGWDSFVGLDGLYNETHLADVLPVIMASSDDRVNFSGPCIVERHGRHEITDGLPFETNAPAIGGFNLLQAKGEAEVLLTSRRFRVAANDGQIEFEPLDKSPLLVVGKFGRGKTAAFASDAAPHWVGPLMDWGDERIMAKAVGSEEIEVGNWYAELFANMIKWVCG